MMNYKTINENQTETNALQEFKVIEVNVTDPSENLYAVVTPVKQ